jgi:quinate dehydrogenase (quinone)
VLNSSSRAVAIISVLLGLVMLAVGVFMLSGGIYLVMLGGSSYFALAGAAVAIAGVLVSRRSIAGTLLYLLTFAATLIWAGWEVGPAFWSLVSRLFAPTALAVAVLLLAPALRPEMKTWRRNLAFGLSAFLIAGLAATVYAAFQPMPMVSPDAADVPLPGHAVAPLAGDDWPHWGRTPSGTRFAPFSAITPQNVAGLKVAWTYRTGDIPKDPAAFVTTPLHVNGKLYGCTQTSIIFALDADTGKELWRYDPKAQGNFRPRCRGVGYHDASQSFGTPPGDAASSTPCTRRILSTTVDARLVALDAETGSLCVGFGEGGLVNLHTGMGKVTPGFYFPTAAPTVMRNLVIVGGLVRDNHDTDEPSGVVRAFDVRTGALAWAWDLGNPNAGDAPQQDQKYTRGTPNVWSTPAFDDALGLVYLPTGNATPDFWGGHRTDAAEHFSSSIVAVDINTGRVRWSFQTVHHDLWDYDVPSQPALYDIPDGHGGTTPALIQTTKRGQIFMLDRRTGTPIAKVEERAVPQTGGAPDDHQAPTQPYSIGMPALGADRLTEARMWGATPLDQLVCRIAFRKARYDGDFTPPGPTTAIQFPGWFGGMNWGSGSVAENLGYFIINDTRIPVTTQLVPRPQFDASARQGGQEGTGAPQYGTPWGLRQSQLMSPLGIPCQAPPYGAITAIDLAGRKIVWSVPLGTLQDNGPLGVAMHLPIPIGLPAIGGPVTTASGLVFMAGTQDHYIRALDVRTGRELWKGRLPMGAETTPITYVSPQSGRQFVVISAGGNLESKDRGDYVVAFALPK